MKPQQYPRSPKILLGGMAHLGRLIDKIRMRHAGQIQDYNYLTTGFDKYLIELLGIAPDELERRVLSARSDDDIVSWIRAHGYTLSDKDLRQWNARILEAGPKDDAARRRFEDRLAGIAGKRGVRVEDLPRATTWVDCIELDEDRM